MAQNCLGRGSPAICRVSGFRRRPSPPANSNAHGGVGIVRMIAPPYLGSDAASGAPDVGGRSNSHAETFDGLTARLTRACAQDVHPPRKPSSQVAGKGYLRLSAAGGLLDR